MRCDAKSRVGCHCLPSTSAAVSSRPALHHHAVSTRCRLQFSWPRVNLPPTCFLFIAVHTRLALHHYAVKSRDEFELKMLRGSAMKRQR